MNAFVENFKDILLNKYAQFTGRANLTEFWQYVLVYILITAVFSLLIILLDRANALKMFMLILNVILMLVLLLPGLALCVRRMHDIGKSGWWVFIHLLPIIGSIWFLILAITDSEPGINGFENNQ